ncbi:MAG: hypothetical protein IPP29_10605 [Bacteroidetes bacterium]|nr:hypothetical protein [Bacteroidota bacterium]
MQFTEYQNDYKSKYFAALRQNIFKLSVRNILCLRGKKRAKKTLCLRGKNKLKKTLCIRVIVAKYFFILDLTLVFNIH